MYVYIYIYIYISSDSFLLQGGMDRPCSCICTCHVAKIMDVRVYFSSIDVPQNRAHCCVHACLCTHMWAYTYAITVLYMLECAHAGVNSIHIHTLCCNFSSHHS